MTFEEEEIERLRVENAKLVEVRGQLERDLIVARGEALVARRVARGWRRHSNKLSMCLRLANRKAMRELDEEAARRKMTS